MTLNKALFHKLATVLKNINLNFDADKALEDGGNFLSSLWQVIVNFFKSLVLKKFHGIIDGNRNVAVFLSANRKRREC